MLMMIDDSIVDAAVEKDSLALQVLQNLAASQTMGYHIIWSSRRNLKQIIKITELSQNDRAIYYSILKSYATSASTYTSIDFYALVSVQEKSNRYNDHIVINPKEMQNFNFVCQTNVLAENMEDGYFFKYIGDYFIRKSKIHSISLCYNVDMGGGDTTAVKYCEYAKKSAMLCLSILDGDKKYKDGKYGDTYKKTLKEDFRKPFNCSLYGTTLVREVENLLPSFLYMNDSNYKKHEIVENNMDFDKSFFDLKEGLYYKRLWEESERNYWKFVFKNYEEVQKRITLAQELIGLSSSAQEYKEVVGKEVIISGFGSKLFSYILTNKSEELGSINNEDLNPIALKHEWDKIGGLMLKWCCSTNVKKVRL